jgi:hypothetical protein
MSKLGIHRVALPYHKIYEWLYHIIGFTHWLYHLTLDEKTSLVDLTARKWRKKTPVIDVDLPYKVVPQFVS